MAYGSPDSLEEVEPYYRSILGGRAPSKEAVDDLTDRYRRVGGRTPLLEITREVAAALEHRLGDAGDDGYKVHVGMKHWHPFVAETVRRIADGGIQRMIAVPLAPHFSKMSTDGYRSAVEEAVRDLPGTMSVRFVESWHANPTFVSAAAGQVRQALADLGPVKAESVEVLFTAHSLPRRILQWDDPYPRELRESCEAVAKAAGVSSWRFAYQSASHTGQPWLGPDILEALATLPGEGIDCVLVVPIGFVSDNLEILFDIDIEAQEVAVGIELKLARVQMLNSTPAFIDALADVVRNGTDARISDMPASES